MKQYEGIIEITKIENTGDNADQIGTLTARFVRYPGCQQMSVWLPEYGGHSYGKLRIMDIRKEKTIEELDVAHKISGSVLMTWDTLSWSPSDYCLEIEHPKGGKHCLYFKKWKVGAFVSKDKIVEMPMATAENPSLAVSLLPKKEPKNKEISDTMWAVYRDGFGNIIPNEDRAIRDGVDEDMHGIFTKAFSKSDNEPRLEYKDHGRSGDITYIEGDIRFTFWHELGGGGCKMYIDIPPQAAWENVTKTPLSRRREILLFIATTVKKEQAPSWRFEINETSIAYY
jgi:hypothetical protein